LGGRICFIRGFAKPENSEKLPENPAEALHCFAFRLLFVCFSFAFRLLSVVTPDEFSVFRVFAKPPYFSLLDLRCHCAPGCAERGATARHLVSSARRPPRAAALNNGVVSHITVSLLDN
jgi:hypothetical protein